MIESYLNHSMHLNLPYSTLRGLPVGPILTSSDESGGQWMAEAPQMSRAGALPLLGPCLARCKSCLFMNRI